MLTNTEFDKFMSDTALEKKVSFIPRLEAFIGTAGVSFVETPKNEIGREMYIRLDKNGNAFKYFKNKKGDYYEILNDGSLVKEPLDRPKYKELFLKSIYNQEEFYNTPDGLLPPPVSVKLLNEEKQNGETKNIGPGL